MCYSNMGMMYDMEIFNMATKAQSEESFWVMSIASFLDFTSEICFSFSLQTCTLHKMYGF